jgi:hypothetical protein
MEGDHPLLVDLVQMATAELGQDVIARIAVVGLPTALVALRVGQIPLPGGGQKAGLHTCTISTACSVHFIGKCWCISIYPDGSRITNQAKAKEGPFPAVAGRLHGWPGSCHWIRGIGYSTSRIDRNAAIECIGQSFHHEGGQS